MQNYKIFFSKRNCIRDSKISHTNEVCYKYPSMSYDNINRYKKYNSRRMSKRVL